MGKATEWLGKMHHDNKVIEMELNGKCHDCGGAIQVISKLQPDGTMQVSGGAVYKPDGVEKPFFKCDSCYAKDSMLRNFMLCEIFTRVVGYMRPLAQHNPGKKAEYHYRINYKM